MESEDLIQVMKQIEEKGMEWTEVEKKISVPYQLLNLYTRSGPVPSTIINKLKKLLEKEEG